MTQPAGPRRAAPDALSYVPRFEYGEMAEVAVVSGPEDGSALGSGFVRLTGARIPWTIRYDEVLVVLEGRVTIHAGAQAIEAGPREAVWLPKGTELVYEAEEALVFYAIHPADWGAHD